MTQNISISAQINEAVSYIKTQTTIVPEIALIMGSGLGVLGDYIENATVIPYESIPNFPVSTVEGHAGELLIGSLSGRNVVLMRGRFHMYEGYAAEVTAFPVRVMKALGAASLVVTNAAGGINLEFAEGNLMLITDHLNLTGKNPLIGPHDPAFGARFPDMTEAYSKRLREVAKQVAADKNVQLVEGIYAGLLGPTYETPAEIKMLRLIGADAVGMSTVAEVIAARQIGLEVVGISCITNMAAGILDQPLTHDEVIETTNRVQAQFLELITSLIAKI